MPSVRAAPGREDEGADEEDEEEDDIGGWRAAGEGTRVSTSSSPLPGDMTPALESEAVAFSSASELLSWRRFSERCVVLAMIGCVGEEE